MKSIACCLHAWECLRVSLLELCYLDYVCSQLLALGRVSTEPPSDHHSGVRPLVWRNLYPPLGMSLPSHCSGQAQVPTPE